MHPHTFEYGDNISQDTIASVEAIADRVGPDGHSLNSLLAHFESQAAEMKAARVAKENQQEL